MNNTALKLVEPVEVEEKALSIVDQAKAVKVVDAESYTAAGMFWKTIKDMMKEVADTFDPLIESAHKQHKLALEKKAKFYAPLENAYKDVKRLMSDYDMEQEKIRKAEEKRLAEIARKEEEERQLQEAILAEQSGNKEEAEAIIEQPVYIPPVVVAKTTPKLSGGPVYRTVWKYRIKNAALIPRQYMIPNETMIGGIVRDSKGVINIPGVEIYSERV